MTFTKDALSGQHIIISGGVGALGTAIVKRLTDHGANVTVNDVIEARDAMARLQDVDQSRVHYVQADLTQQGDVDRFVADARDKFGSINTALCHAGVVISAYVMDITPQQFNDAMSINVKAAMFLAQAAAKSMIADGVNGQLLFTTSWVANVSWPEIGAYTTSKAAMNQLMRMFARELAGQGIRANAVAPGIVGAGMAKRQWDTEPEYRARASRAIPLGEMQSPESVADAFVFMCSPASSYMTGSILTVDGGCSLYPSD